MSSIAEFLSARLDEDQAAAQKAIDVQIDPSSLSWSWFPKDRQLDFGINRTTHLQDDGVEFDEEMRHITRHNPVKVLRDVKAKRAILDRWLKIEAENIALGSRREPEADAIAGTLEDAVCSLATVYADHPDYQEEWRPIQQ